MLAAFDARRLCTDTLATFFRFIKSATPADSATLWGRCAFCCSIATADACLAAADACAVLTIAPFVYPESRFSIARHSPSFQRTPRRLLRCAAVLSPYFVHALFVFFRPFFATMPLSLLMRVAVHADAALFVFDIIFADVSFRCLLP